MHATLMRRLAAVCVATAAAFGLAMGSADAGALALCRPSQGPAHEAPRAFVSQAITQHATINQHATARAFSGQVLPVNLNLPMSEVFKRVVAKPTDSGDPNDYK